MPNFVELWVYLASTPLFGLTATILVYLLAVQVYVRLKQAPWANPVLWSVIVLCLGLATTDVAYPRYFAGAQFIHFLLGPAVVALAWPLWQRLGLVRRRWWKLLLAALAGGVTASGSAVALAWAFGLPREVLLSLVPKSATAPVAMGIAERIGGIPSLAAVFAILTGLAGAMSAKYLYAALKVDTTPAGWAARGFALGTTSHGIGAARALQVDADAGAYAGIALSAQVILQSVLIPLLFQASRA